MLERADVEKRRDRLEELARGLAKEVQAWRKGDDPLLYLERKACLNSIQRLSGAATRWRA